MQTAGRHIVKDLHRFFLGRKQTLSVAESCTGGLVSHMITDHAGASAYFDSALVTYSTLAKTDLVGVPSLTLLKEGTVSEETARQMAEGLRRTRKTDFALSVTGNLGPSAMDGKGVGLVFVAVASHHRTLVSKKQFSGTRRQIKKQAAMEALRFLLACAMETPASAEPVR